MKIVDVASIIALARSELKTRPITLHFRGMTTTINLPHEAAQEQSTMTEPTDKKPGGFTPRTEVSEVGPAIFDDPQLAGSAENLAALEPPDFDPEPDDEGEEDEDDDDYVGDDEDEEDPLDEEQ